MLPPGGVAAMPIIAEYDRIDTQLTSENGQDLGISVLAHVEHATWKARVAELHGEAQLSRGTTVTADQLQVLVRQRVEARQRMVVQGGRQLGELGALGRSEQLAGRHGGLAYAASSAGEPRDVVAENCVFAATTLSLACPHQCQ